MDAPTNQPPVIPYAGPPASGLSSQQMQEIAAARANWGKVRRAISMATFDSWTTGIFAVLTLLGGLASVSALLLGLGMGVISVNGFRNTRAFKRLDLRASERLAKNQVAFGLMLLAYGVVGLVTTARHPPELEQLAGAGVDPEMLQTIGSIASTAYMAMYVGVIAAAIIGPGLMAMYYRSRRKYLEAYLRDTPQWIRSLQDAGMF